MTHLPGFTAAAALERGTGSLWRAKLSVKDLPQIVPQLRPCDVCDVICEHLSEEQCNRCYNNCLS
jgi:hypothetical protein